MTYDELQRLAADTPRLAVYVTLPGCGPCEAVRPWLEPAFATPGVALGSGRLQPGPPLHPEP